MQNINWKGFEIHDAKNELGLKRIRLFLKTIENPQNNLPTTIHVAGTNGKGSTIAFIKYILESQNQKVHRFISPHLIEYNERIEIAGKKITDAELKKQLNYCEKLSKKQNLPISFFETITTIAFIEFAKHKANFTLLETGLGGRLDSTNVIKNLEVCVITPISIDHTVLLGNSIEEIAAEKAGIIKENCPVVISKQTPEAFKVLEKIAKEKNAPIYIYGKDWKTKKTKSGFIFEGFGQKIEVPKPSLAGDHQIINASTAIATLLVQKKLKILEKSIKTGVSTTKWPARMQNITNRKKLTHLINKNSEVFLDGGHNEDGFLQIANFIKEKSLQDNTQHTKKNIVIVGMLKRKNVKNCLKHLKDTLDYGIGIKISDNDDSIDEKDLREIFCNLKIPSVTRSDFREALEFISHNFKEPTRIIICGSLYLAGEILSFLKK